MADSLTPEELSSITYHCVDCRDDDPDQPEGWWRQAVESLIASARAQERTELVEQLTKKWKADIERYETALRIGAVPAENFETRITNTMGHISDLGSVARDRANRIESSQNG